MGLGQKIKTIREKHNLKQLDLANAMQVSPQAVSKWERDENYPDIAGLLKLSRILGVTTDYLLGITDEKPGVFEATVFSSGIHHFAERSIVMNSREVADWTNVLFHHLTEAVLKFDGVPIKYVGDGFLCFFSGSRHADRALQAALHAKKVIQNNELIITLNAGDIYLGAIGHPDYSSRDIIGDTVNQAFLIMEWVQKNTKSGIGVTENVKRHIKKVYTFKKYENVSIKLTKSKQNIYEVLNH